MGVIGNGCRGSGRQDGHSKRVVEGLEGRMDTGKGCKASGRQD